MACQLTFKLERLAIDSTEGASDNGQGLTSVFRIDETSPDFVKVTSIFYPELQHWYRVKTALKKLPQRNKEDLKLLRVRSAPNY
ncbi:MAG: hypothetical protein WBL50_21800 [Candidatus Acidiferrum sp.]